MINKLLVLVVCSLFVCSLRAQELLVDGGFDNGSAWFLTAGSQGQNAWFALTPCPQQPNNQYLLFGDINDNSGVNFLNEGLYQQFTIPAASTQVSVSFKASVSTLETGPTPWDFLEINLYNAQGTFLANLWTIDNSFGTFGIPGCSPWIPITTNIPSAYFGQTVRLAFEASTDVTLPTNFRIDDASVLASQSSGCTYSLSSTNFVCANSSANTYSNVVLMNTQNSCAWSATVLSGSDWLVTSSSGTGSGGVNITVTENTSVSPRTGIIAVGGQSFTVSQPSGSCTYNLSTTNYVCPSAMGGNLTGIALVNTQAGCDWAAAVTSGGEWLACSSSNSGSGAIDIVVLENTTPNAKVGTISVQGQTLTITQPAGSVTSVGLLEESSVIIYPNPARDKVTISGVGLISDLEVFDTQGKAVQIVATSLPSSVSIDVSSLQSGLYLIKSASNGLVRRLQVVH